MGFHGKKYSETTDYDYGITHRLVFLKAFPANEQSTKLNDAELCVLCVRDDLSS